MHVYALKVTEGALDLATATKTSATTRFKISYCETSTEPDWKLCHAHGRSSVRTSNSTCTNENLGAHIFVQEVLGAHVKQTKIKLYLSGLQVLWSIMT